MAKSVRFSVEDAPPPLGLPAVVGGGDAKTGPFWPPDRDPEHLGEIIFGAPDGVEDGIILTLNSAGDGDIQE